MTAPMALAFYAGMLVESWWRGDGWGCLLAAAASVASGLWIELRHPSTEPKD